MSEPSKKTDAWMPLWIGSYLADTQHLNRDEHGGYFLLLMAYWRNESPLNDDDKRLSSIVKASPKEWKLLRPVLAEFFKIENGFWIHKRVEKELSEAKNRQSKAADKAKAAADARWGNRDKHSSSNAPSIPQAMQDECPTPSPTPIISNSNELLVVSDADNSKKKATCPHQEIIAIYHELLPQCPQVRDWTSARATNLRARWNEEPRRQNLEYWRMFFEYVAKCDFLVGKGGGAKPFFASLAWIVKSENFVKIREGNYANH